MLFLGKLTDLFQLQILKMLFLAQEDVVVPNDQ